MRSPCLDNCIARSDGFSGFVEGPVLFNPNMRHAAVLKRGVRAVGVLDPGRRCAGTDLAEPDRSGAAIGWSGRTARRSRFCGRNEAGRAPDAPLTPSVRSTAYGMVNQLRDPAIFEEDGRMFLLYAVAGESGIAIAEVFLDGAA